MKKIILNFILNRYKEDVNDFIVKQFIGEIPDDIREPALDFLADRRILFEKFLSIQAYNIQRQRILSKKGADFYDGALMIIRAFLAAVNKKVVARSVLMPQVDQQKETEDNLAKVSDFMKAGRDLSK